MRLALTLALLTLLTGVARADTTASVPMVVTVVEPALEVTVRSAALDFGGAVQPDTLQEALTDLEIAITDQASGAQATSGWHVTAVATALGPMPPSRLAFRRGQASVAQSAGPEDQAAPAEPGGPPEEALDHPVRLLQAAGPDESKGTWVARFPGSAFALAVPGDVAAGSYQGVLTLTVHRGL